MKTYRTYAVIASVLIPLFWFVLRVADPLIRDPLWIRLLLTLVTLAALNLSYTSARVRRHFIAVMRGLFYVYTIWLIGLSAANAFSPNYSIGLLFVITAVAVAFSTGLTRTEPLVAYLAFASAITTLVMLVGADRNSGEVDLFIFVICVISIALVIYVAASATIRAQARLSVSQMKYQRLFASANDALLLIHPGERKILEANKKAAELYGYDTEEMVGLPLERLTRDADEANRWLSRTPSESLEIVHFGKDDRRLHLLVSTALIEYEGQIVYLSINRDITDRLRTMRRLATINETLVRRNRELDAFTTAAAHDLQEPIRKIRTFADLILEESRENLDEKQRHYLNRLQTIAGYLGRIVNDLMVFSEITTKPTPLRKVDLAAVADEVISDLSEEISESGAKVTTAGLPVLHADPAHMHALLYNLLANSIVFRRPGVPPLVTVTGSLTSRLDGQSICRIEIQDNGTGIDEKHLSRIFAPFQKLGREEHRHGSGMGLAICRRIVERHHGTLRATSSPGVGTTMIIELPTEQPILEEEAA